MPTSGDAEAEELPDESAAPDSSARGSVPVTPKQPVDPIKKSLSSMFDQMMPLKLNVYCLTFPFS